jgi:hypothetical protein
MPLLGRIADAYRKTSKPKDIFWNKYVARPLAAPFVAALERTRVTPNQVTFVSLIVFCAGAAALVLVPGHAGLVVAAAVIEASYVLDCVDGQLARLRGTSSPVGAHLDFLMDELKAFLLVGTAAVRLWQERGDELWLLEGLGGLVAVASAITLTTFVRRPEYVATTGKRPPAGAGDYGEGFAAAAASPPPASLVARALRPVEALGRLVVHYPTYLLVVAAVDRLDLFLHVYLAVNAAYAARSFLGVALRLGRFSA